jgi:hypothetical protein
MTAALNLYLAFHLVKIINGPWERGVWRFGDKYKIYLQIVYETLLQITPHRHKDSEGKGKVVLCLFLIEHYAMTAYWRVEL